MSLCGHSARPVLRIALAVTSISAAATACGESVIQVDEGDIVELRLAPDSALLGVGRTLRMQALPLDETGALLVGQEIMWSSSPSGVATVDESGLVTGAAPGEAEITASAGGFSAASVVTVQTPPSLVLSADMVSFSAQAGGAEPDPDSVFITNPGELDLVGLAVDSIAYGAGAEDWLDAQLSSAAAPSTLRLEAETAGITSAGAYEAVVWVSGTDADGSPAPVTVLLTVEAGTAASLSINDGDGQTSAAGSAVATSPSVLITDAFGNPVSGVQITFTLTAGGGSLGGSVATSDASGIARVGSWTLGTTAGANALDAAGPGLPTVSFSATGIPGPAAQLAISAGDGQSAVAGSDVAVAPAVEALDEFGNGVEGVSVAFEVVAGEGSVTGASGMTDADGAFAVGSWTLGTTAGENTLRARATSIPDSVKFTATGLTGEAQAIVLEAGDAQTDTVAATLSTPYAVKIVDSNGNGVAGIPVSWEVTGGGGSMDASASTTDADGIATSVRVLGTTAGSMTAQGAVGGLEGSPVVFTATALPGAPAIMAKTAGDGQTATVDTDVGVALRVSVTDQFGNAIEGESVTFSVTGGGGSVSPTTAVSTAADGTASLTSWTLGTVAGTSNNTVEALAASGGIAGNPGTFTASATADAPASVTIVSGDGQTAVSGTNVASPPTVEVTDQFGNPVSGATVDFAPSSGSSVGTPSATTDGSGQASTSWTVTTDGSTMQTDGTFPKTLDAAVQGTALATSFSGVAIYSFVNDVHPIVSSTCTGCHGGFSGLTFSEAPSENYSALVGVVPVCDGTLASTYRRVSSVGGTVAATDYSILMRFVDPSALGPIGTCGDDGHPQPLSPAELDIFRAWIRNSAPNN